MKNRKTFGLYLQKKRKEADLSQKELANRLSVLKSTIGKWENGISYPDVAIVPDLCRELKIDEAEFFDSISDEEIRYEKWKINSYWKIFKSIVYVLNIVYGLTLMAAFFANLIMNHTLSWFWVAAAGILCAFYLSSLPALLRHDRYRWIKSWFYFSISLFILLFMIHMNTKGDWLGSAYLFAGYLLLYLWNGLLLYNFTDIPYLYKISLIFLLLAILFISLPLLPGNMQFEKEVLSITEMHSLALISFILCGFFFILEFIRKIKGRF